MYYTGIGNRRGGGNYRPGFPKKCQFKANYTDGVLKLGVPKFLTGVSYEMTLLVVVVLVVRCSGCDREIESAQIILPVDNLWNIKSLSKMKGK